MSLLSQQLSFRARHKLASILDCPNVRGCDWRGVVELMGFSYEMVMMLRTRESPTMALLEEWEMREGDGASLETLISIMKELENAPAHEMLITIKKESNKKPLPRSPLSTPLTMSPRGSFSLSPRSSFCASPKSSLGGYTSTSPCSSLGTHTDYFNGSKHQSSNYLSSSPSNLSISPNCNMGRQLTHQLQSLLISQKDIDRHNLDENHVNGKDMGIDRRLLENHEFDVFLSFAPADIEFAGEMKLRLYHRAGLRVYIPSEGLIAGQSFQDEIADKIRRGCNKTIIILSPDYNDCSWCNYEARLAHHKSPDPRWHHLIPVMYRKCSVPAFIAHLFYLDYTRYKDDARSCEEYFWERLYKSVRYQQR